MNDRMKNQNAQINGVRGGVVHNAIDQRQIDQVSFQGLQRERSLENRIRELDAEKRELVARNQSLRTRPDLPADHLPQRLEILNILDERNARIRSLELENEVLRDEVRSGSDRDDSLPPNKMHTPLAMGAGMMYLGAVGILIAIVFGRSAYIAMDALNAAKDRIETLEGVVRQSMSFVRDIASQANIQGATRHEVESWIDEMERIGLATDDEIRSMIRSEGVGVGVGMDARSIIETAGRGASATFRPTLPIPPTEPTESKGDK